ncbi:ATP-binding cassette domain-containing protein [Streptomyces sp. KL116D]|uniref:ATP-binding cassette domain-containing protein n=1 Tax=Streptomyces sp. KL116D TaxID=3045152 RepID=UPI0035560C0F
MIEAVGLTKRYGAKTAVYNAFLPGAAGTVTGFLGPNGSGQVDDVRMILGLDQPTSGHVTIGGATRTASSRTRRRQVGALLDAKAVHGGRTARSHLLSLAQLAGIPARRARRSARCGRSAGGRETPLEGVLAGHGSSGSASPPRSSATRRCCSSTSRSTGSTPEGILWVRNLMKSLAAEGRTVFVSSHLMSEMALTAEHLIVIGRGQLLADMMRRGLHRAQLGGLRPGPHPDSEPQQRGS